ncbi:MAG: exosortase system-associated protein, TIGR04073 family [Candidatus Omnitrophica bacterium]|nr:exosortase system-associated protein, TIGR04073 family [Candidatus Omnitrophota bacterium]
MKNKISFGARVVVLLFVFLASSVCSAQAADAWTKLGRGLNNIVFSPLEILYRPQEMKNGGDSWANAVAGGVFKGGGYFAARLGTGLYEVLTFPHPGPSGYEPLIYPEHLIGKN